MRRAITKEEQERLSQSLGKHRLLVRTLKRAGWTQKELAARSGLSENDISAFVLLNRYPTDEKANAIQKAFGEVNIYFDVLEAWPLRYRSLVTEQFDDECYLSFGDSAEGVELAEIVSRVHEAVATLTKRQQAIIHDWMEGYTYEELAQRFGFGKERARQLVSRALRQLRYPSRSMWLEGLIYCKWNYDEE